MTNDNSTNQLKAEDTAARPRLLLMIGSVLWVLCLLGIVYGWYQWRQKVLAAKAESAIVKADEDLGQSPKQMKLVLQKDGSFIAQEVTLEQQASPWDAEGIEDFSFTDTNHQPLTKQDLIGKPFIISFVFTRCLGPCPNVTRQMRELQDRLQDYDFNLVTLTVDPERDTIETLQRYGKDQGANFDRWKFLTGNQADIYGLIQRSFKMPVEEATGPARQPGFEIIHSTNIMLVDATGRVVGKFDAQNDEQMARLRRELKNLAKQQSNDKSINEEGQR